MAGSVAKLVNPRLSKNMARAAKCQKGALPAKRRSLGYSAARRRRSPLAALEKPRDFENRTYAVGAVRRSFRRGGRHKTPRNNRGGRRSSPSGTPTLASTRPSG